ncbi:katanin p80 WD40 repeat-containing subunit B1 [Erpetoichthys calabaricus]|uniref:Katanin p80 WD40 repeat-containing subunit B1 n=1 Tax=Erpetoichthys calabaricus TaxID=27687 RepID=A0A8C4S5V0_ERPCA|nr:katanin p80 WD40 repeat-containing subunit B1 [Erpetoichthys calabaricus]
MASSSTTKKSWKLQEIVAHSSNVSSLVLGKTSGRLLATGGEDCRVNIWAINKPNCIMSLTGHNNPVECIQFSSTEEQVVAGSQSGSLRVWDLEAAKILRTLMGHKANICSLDFHPFGEYVASGSMDTNIKLWDVRRKGCVFSYKGHMQAVRCLCFSPDGKWLASASDDSTIKLWDLTAGKMITEFTAHTGPVNVVEFHPNEYLLASGSSDRTVKFWDLEKFQMIGSTEVETGPIKCIAFNPDGCCLYSGSQDSLRVYGWEPDRCFDVVSVTWGKVADLAICSNQLIGVSFNLTNVSSFVVDLSRVKKSGSMIQGLLLDDKPLTEPYSKGTTIRRNYDRPLTTCSKPQRVKQNSESDRKSPEGDRQSPSSEEDKDEKESTAEIRNPEDYKEIFQPKNAISRTPPKKSEPFPAPPEDESFTIKPSTPLDALTPVPEKIKLDQLKMPPVASSTPVNRVEPTIVPPTSRAQPVAVSAPSKVEPAVIPASRNEPIGLKATDFLPPAKNNNQLALSDDDALSQIRKGHETMCVVLTSRYKNLDTVRTVWSSGDIKNSLDSAVTINDLSVVVDMLNIINLKPCLWKLDLCTSILPQIEKLLQSKYESYVQTGCTSLKLILQRFLPLITDNLAALPSVGVDITREERHQKCKACYKQLKNLSNVVKSKAGLVGRHGSAFRELQLLMASLE